MGLEFSKPSVYALTPPTIKRRIHHKLFESPIVSLERPVEQFFDEFSDGHNTSVIAGELFQTPSHNSDLMFFCKTDILIPNERRDHFNPIEGGLELKGEIGITKELARNKVLQFSIEPTNTPQICADYSHRVESTYNEKARSFLYTTGVRVDVASPHSNYPLTFFRFSFDTAKLSSGLELCVPAFTPSFTRTSPNPNSFSLSSTLSSLTRPVTPPSSSTIREVGNFWLAYKILPEITCATEFGLVEKAKHSTDRDALADDIFDDDEDEENRGIVKSFEKGVERATKEVGRTIRRAMERKRIEERETVRQLAFKKIALQYSLANSHQFTLSFAQSPLTSNQTFSLSMFQHNILRRQIWNPLEEVENKYINNIIDIVFKISMISSTVVKQRELNSTIPFVLNPSLSQSAEKLGLGKEKEVVYEERREVRSKLQMGINWQINKNIAFKAKLNQNGLSLMSTFKSWSNPAFSISLSACNMKPFTSSP